MCAEELRTTCGISEKEIRVATMLHTTCVENISRSGEVEISSLGEEPVSEVRSSLRVSLHEESNSPVIRALREYFASRLQEKEVA